MISSPGVVLADLRDVVLVLSKFAVVIGSMCVRSLSSGVEVSDARDVREGRLLIEM